MNRSARASWTSCWRCWNSAALAGSSWRKWRNGCATAGPSTKAPLPARHQEWLAKAQLGLTDTLAQQAADQAADNLSVSNAITSLRAIGDADWPDIVARTSTLMRLMLTSPVFQAEDSGTRDQSLHDLEKLARRSGCSEISVAKSLLSLMNAPPVRDSLETVPGHWLRGSGRPELMRAIGFQEPFSAAWRALARRAALPAYMGALIGGTVGVLTWLLARHGADNAWRHSGLADAAGIDADAVPRLRGRGGRGQPPDQRIGTASPPAATGPA